MEPDSFIDFDSLLNDAAREILRDEDAGRLAAWLRRHVARYVEPDARDAVPPEMLATLSAHLSRAIWNATPLPGNRFRPAPLPAPGRNDPCPCGSGRKYKQCCASAPDFPHIDNDLMWSFVLDNIEDNRLARGIADKQVPASALVQYALGLMDDDDPGSALEVLEPIFEEQPLASLRSTAHEHALDLACNAYDDLGREEDKMALLDRVVRDAARSPLRAGAWQRLAAVRMDRGDADGAWDAFRQAQRDQPDVPALAHLEITLLCEQRRFDEAVERAQHWQRRLRRKGFEDGDVIVDWLGDVARDPAGAAVSLAIRESDDEGALLRERLAAMQGRALPRYTLSHEPRPLELPDVDGEDDDELLADRLRAMGVAPDQIADALCQLREDLSAIASDPAADDDDAMPEPLPDGIGDSQVLVPPAYVREVEAAWREVFDGDKPFSVNDEPLGDTDPWESEAEWCALLARRPEAFDSLDVLDDLATVVNDHERADDDDFAREMLLPILERARAIVRLAVVDAQSPHLAWALVDNRVALRPLVRLAMWNLYCGDRAYGLTLAEEVLALNPGDNHGLRALLVDGYLGAGRDREALALGDRFPHDMLAETSYGRALALFRLERREEADEALQRAVDDLPLVQEYLVRNRVREPAPDGGFGMTVGGEEQAWHYRQGMRAVWEATPGALQWLAQKRPRRAVASKKRAGPGRR